MDIHLCMTCGERWGVGTSQAGMKNEEHRLKGHRVLLGDDAVLKAEADRVGLSLVDAGEPLAIYRCFDCEENWVHGTEDAYQKSVDHKAQGHFVLVGDEPTLTSKSRADFEPVIQGPNPLDPESVTKIPGYAQTFGVADGLPS